MFASLLLASGCRGESRPQPTTPAPPRRVVTLIPSLTELVFSIGCGNRVVATDDFSNHPEAARRLPKVGGMRPSTERIARLKPDVVLGSSILDQSEVSRALAPLGIRFEVFQTDRLVQIEVTTRKLVAVLGCGDAEKWIAAFRAGLAAERRVRATRPRVLYIAWPDPLYVAGQETFADDLLRHVGAENAVAASVRGWPQFSLETVVASPPDVLIFPTSAMTQEQFTKTLQSHPVWSHLEVVKQRRFQVVDEDRFNRPGPRVIDAARELNAILDRLEFR